MSMELLHQLTYIGSKPLSVILIILEHLRYDIFIQSDKHE